MTHVCEMCDDAPATIQTISAAWHCEPCEATRQERLTSTDRDREAMQQYIYEQYPELFPKAA